MDTIKNLNILHEHLESLNVQIQNELAKGKKCNTEKLLDLVCAVSTCSHSNFAATERIRQKMRSEFIEKSQPQLIKLSQNNLTSGLSATAGTLQLLVPLITIGALLTGMPASGVDALLKMPLALLEKSGAAIGALGGASSGMDKARPMALEFAIQKERDERNDDQSSQQASKTHESEGLRLLKEILNSRASKEQSVAKGG